MYILYITTGISSCSSSSDGGVGCNNNAIVIVMLE